MSHRFHWTWPALYMLLILALSTIPGGGPDPAAAEPPWWLSPVVTNFLHVPLYAGFALAWAVALTVAAGMTSRRAAVLMLMLVAGFGVLDELYQGMIPGRNSTLGDWLADTFGAVIGCVLFLWYRRRAG